MFPICLPLINYNYQTKYLPLKNLESLWVRPLRHSLSWLWQPSPQITRHTMDFPCLVFSRIGLAQSTYVCRVQSSVWRLPKYWPPQPLSTQWVCHPRTKGGGGGRVLAGRWGGGGLIFWKTPDIGLASYSIIPLRDLVSKCIPPPPPPNSIPREVLKCQYF